ncbi:MAG TPA: hypothetical protein VGJ91_23415 [Polyangiaceae bacterium]
MKVAPQMLYELSLSMASFIAEIDSNSVNVAAYIEQRLQPLIPMIRTDERVRAAIERIVKDGRKLVARAPAHYPPGMGEESRRLHREYNALVAAQNAGAKNGAEVVRLTDECAAKGIILVPGGENL